MSRYLVTLALMTMAVFLLFNAGETEALTLSQFKRIAGVAILTKALKPSFVPIPVPMHMFQKQEHHEHKPMAWAEDGW